MGILSGGINGHFRGRKGKTVFYILNGQNVSREIGENNKPPSNKQLKNRLLTKVCSEFFCAVRDFIDTGFSIEARTAKDNAYNQAVKNNKANLLKGDYPDLEFNFEQILLSKGDLSPAENLEVTLIPLGLQFNWQTDPKMAWPDAADQVMILAYFPKPNRAEYELFGNNRISGTAQLEIPPSLQGAYMEVYFSFISADRTRVSNSVYAGCFNKPEEKDQSLIAS
jgi:hypothetical protein